MAATTFSVTFDNTTDTTFRTWVAAVLMQMDALTGWTRTSDTGQINTGTATRSASAAVNYAVWKTTSGLTTIYVRMDFANPGGSGFPGMAITVGYSTDGAGSITGTQATPRMGLATNATGEAVSRTCVISGAAERFALAMNVTSPNNINSHLFSVERSVDAAGAYVAGGLTAIACNGSSFTPNATANMIYLPESGGLPNMESRLPAILTNAGSSAFGSTIGFSPVIPLAGSAQNPGINFLVYHVSDFSAFATPTIAVYGTNRVYYCLGNNLSASVGISGVTATNGRLAMLFE